MSVIQRIRDRAAWIVTGAIGVSLLAFILQDYFFNKGRSLMGNGTTIGKIDGKSIDRDAFEHKVSFYEQMNNGQVQRSQLIPQVWEYLVNQTIVNDE
ncbi:MAG: SurA N-terminal domain-containing protein, partial [Parafilimonas sp.]|nr:SurA N-terminal domain-containing protein [Parafilimonas sp.]